MMDNTTRFLLIWQHEIISKLSNLQLGLLANNVDSAFKSIFRVKEYFREDENKRTIFYLAFNKSSYNRVILDPSENPSIDEITSLFDGFSDMIDSYFVLCDEFLSDEFILRSTKQMTDKLLQSELVELAIMYIGEERYIQKTDTPRLNETDFVEFVKKVTN